MQPDFFDNRTRIVKDDLVASIGAGDRVAVAAEVFSMYAYQELAEQLTTRKLGCDGATGMPEMTMRLDTEQSRSLLAQFDAAWDSGELHDVTEAVIDGITAMYQESAPNSSMSAMRTARRWKTSSRAMRTRSRRLTRSCQLSGRTLRPSLIA